MTTAADYKPEVIQAVERGLEARELFEASFLHQARSPRLNWTQEMTNLELVDLTEKIIEAVAQGEDIRTDGTIQIMYSRPKRSSQILSREFRNDHEARFAQLKARIEERTEEGDHHCSLGFHTNLLNGRIQTEYTRPSYDRGELIPISTSFGIGALETLTMGTPLLGGVTLLATVPYTAFSGYRHFMSEEKKSLCVYVRTASDMYNPKQLETLKNIHRELSAIAPQQKI